MQYTADDVRSMSGDDVDVVLIHFGELVKNPDLHQQVLLGKLPKAEVYYPPEYLAAANEISREAWERFAPGAAFGSLQWLMGAARAVKRSPTPEMMLRTVHPMGEWLAGFPDPKSHDNWCAHSWGRIITAFLIAVQSNNREAFLGLIERRGWGSPDEAQRARALLDTFSFFMPELAVEPRGDSAAPNQPGPTNGRRPRDMRWSGGRFTSAADCYRYFRDLMVDLLRKGYLAPAELTAGKVAEWLRMDRNRHERAAGIDGAIEKLGELKDGAVKALTDTYEWIKGKFTEAVVAAIENLNPLNRLKVPGGPGGGAPGITPGTAATLLTPGGIPAALGTAAGGAAASAAMSAADRLATERRRAQISEPVEAAIARGRTMMGSKEWIDLCQRFIEHLFGTSGQYRTARAAGDALITSQGGRLGDVPRGALAFFGNYADTKGAGHVGLSLGGGAFLHAGQNGVTVSDPTTRDMPYWQEHFRGYGFPTFGTAANMAKYAPPVAGPTAPVAPPAQARAAAAPTVVVDQTLNITSGADEATIRAVVEEANADYETDLARRLSMLGANMIVER